MHRYRRMAAPLTVLILFSNLIWAEDSVEDLRRAQKLLEDQNYIQAASLLEQVNRRQPALADSHRLLGHAYYHLDRMDDARKELVQAIANGRLTLDVLERLTQIDQAKNNTAALHSGLRLRMLFEPNDISWHLFYADILAASGARAEAEHLFDVIIEADPFRPDAYKRLGNLHLLQGKHESAVFAFENAHHLGKTNQDLQQTIAELWFQMGDLRQACKWYEQSLRLQESPPERSQLRWAELLLGTKEFDRAEAAARPLAYSKNTDRAGKALVLLGQISMHRNNIQSAVNYWERAVESGRKDHQILAFLGGHYFNSGNYEKASFYIGHRLSGDNQDPELHRYLIISLIRSNKKEGAKGQMLKYLERYGLDDQSEALLLFFI